MKLTWRENAGRNDWIALQQDSQSDSGRPFAGFSMVPSMGDRGSATSVRIKDSQFVNDTALMTGVGA